MSRTPKRIFLSHTSELRKYPAARSFIEAAERGVVRSGNVTIDMEYFASRDQLPAAVCREKVAEADVFVAVLGFKYGSIVRGDSSISYTELEFDEATSAGKPRLIFLLSDETELPVRLVDADRQRQDRFRARVRDDGVVSASFTNTHDLELQVYQALMELDRAVESAPDGRPEVPWMMPATWNTVVPRPELFGRLAKVLRDPGAQAVGITTGLHGAGGFGKTTLAAEICLLPELRERYPDGLLWVTVGEETNGVALAEKINDLTEVVSGRRPTLSDPQQAGNRLGEVLGDRVALIVVDDAWTRTQVAAFLHGASRCTRLVTTRIRGVLPADTVEIEVDAMEVAESRALLSGGLPEIPGSNLNMLIGMTGGWPVLLALVNSSLRRLVRRGLSTTEAAERIGQRLLAGPTALDVKRPQERNEAVAATIEASFAILSPGQLDRYLELAIFPEDTLIPLDALRLWWGVHGVSGPDVEQLCEEFADLSLLQSYRVSPEAVSLHDVIRHYLRARCGPERLRAMNDDFLVAAASCLSTPATAGEDATWWQLPDDQQYLWSNLAYHLGEAGRDAERRRLIGDLRWVCTKLDRLGPVEVEADLTHSDEPQAVELSREIGRSADLLTPIVPRESLQDILLSRLYGIATLEPAVEAYERDYRPARIRPLRPLPDWPHPALRRILHGPDGQMFACAVGSDGRTLLAGGADRRLRLWDIETGEVRRIMDGHTGPIWSCAAATDAAWAVSGSDDHTIRLWDLDAGEAVAVLNHHQGAVRACVIDPGGKWVASASDDSTVMIWSRESDSVVAVMRGHEGVIRSLTVSPDGTWLASGGDDLTVRVWDVASATQRHVLHGHADSIWAVIAGPEGAWLASGGLDRTVRMWSPETGEQLRVLQTPSSPILAHGGSPDGPWLATGGDEGTIQIWNLDGDELRGTLSGHLGRVRACAVVPGGQWLATAADDISVRIWDIWTVGKETAREPGAGPEWTCAAGARNDVVARAGADRNVRVSRSVRDTGRILGRLPLQPWASAVSPSGHRVAMATQDGRLWLWDGESEELISSVCAHDGPIWACTFSADGQRLLTAGEDRFTRLYDVSDGISAVNEFPYARPVRACAIGADGSTFYAAEDGGFVRHTDIGTRDLITAWWTDQKRIWTLALAPDGSWLATGGEDGTVRIWDPAGAGRGVYAEHGARVRGCAASPDSTRLASVSSDRTIRIWQISDGTCLAALRVSRPFAACCWMADGKTVYVAGDGGIYAFGLNLAG